MHLLQIIVYTHTASVRNSHPGSTPSVILYDRESQWITTGLCN